MLLIFKRFLNNFYIQVYKGINKFLTETKTENQQTTTTFLKRWNFQRALM